MTSIDWLFIESCLIYELALELRYTAVHDVRDIEEWMLLLPTGKIGDMIRTGSVIEARLTRQIPDSSLLYAFQALLNHETCRSGYGAAAA